MQCALGERSQPAPVLDYDDNDEDNRDDDDCIALQDDAVCAGGEVAAGPCFGYLWADAGGPLVCNGLLSGVVTLHIISLLCLLYHTMYTPHGLIFEGELGSRL